MFEVDFSKIQGLQRALERYPYTLRTAMAFAMEKAEDVLYKEAVEYGERPSYPIRWVSETQRRAFFGTQGFGRGIPTERTDQLYNSWQKAGVILPENSIIGKVFTAAQFAAFVQDRDNQSPIFADTWTPVQAKWEERVPELRALFKEALAESLQNVFIG